MELNYSGHDLDDQDLTDRLQTLEKVLDTRNDNMYKAFDLKHNRLKHLPELSQKKEFSELKKLYVSLNTIKEVTIKNIPGAITELDLHRNHLYELVDFSPLVNLHTLRLDSNNISGILSGRLLPSQLECLNVSKNKIVKVCNTHHLSKLKNILLHENNISVIDGLPENLDLITLINNPLVEMNHGCFASENMYNTIINESNNFEYGHLVLSYEQVSKLQIPPPDIFREGFQALMLYFRDDKLMVSTLDDTQKQWRDNEKENLVQTCVLRAFIGGRYRFGKTSLARSLLCNRGCTTHPVDRTAVLDFRSWKINDNATVTLFDLGGHSCYQQIAHLFHSNCRNNVSIIPHDITSSDYDSTCQWITDVVARSPESSIELVLTKSDLVDDVKKKAVKTEFKKHLEDYLNKEGQLLNISKMLKSDEVVSRVTQVSEKYQSIKEHIDEIVHVVSCETEEGLNEFRKVITDKISDDKFKVTMPKVARDLYQRLGKLGVEIDQESKSLLKLEKRRKSFPTSQKIPSRNLSHSNTVLNLLKEDETIQTFQTSSLTSQNDDDLAKENLQFVTFQEAKAVMKEFVSGPDSKVTAELRSCLRHLHNHGLLFWFEGSEALEKFIFNDISSLIDLLKSLFNHEGFSYDLLSTTQLHFLQQNNIDRTKYSKYLKKLYEEGLLSVSLLRILAKKFGFDSNVKTLIAILNHLKILFTIPSEDEEDKEHCWMYFPWYVERKQIPEDVKGDISEMKTQDPNKHVIHVRIKGYIPSAFFHCFTVGILKYIEPGTSHNRRRVWKNSFFTTRKKTKVYLEHSRNKDGGDAIDVYITCPLDAKSIQKSWEFLSQCKKVRETLVFEWWPGMIDDMYLVCRHCKDTESSITPNRWPIDEVLLPRQLDANEDIHCDGDETPFPPALIYRMPDEAEEAKKWLEALEEYLRKLSKDNADIKGEVNTKCTELQLQTGAVRKVSHQYQGQPQTHQQEQRRDLHVDNFPTQETGSIGYYPMVLPAGNGLVAVFANFTGDLKGYNHDIENIKSFFMEELEYASTDVIIHEDLCKQKFDEGMAHLQKRVEEKENIDRLFVFILSHGDAYGVNMCMEGSDTDMETDSHGKSVTVNVKQVTNMFHHDKVPKLKGLPKVFIVQACHGTETCKAANSVHDQGELPKPEYVVAASKSEGTPKGLGADILLCQASCHGTISWVNESGSVYITNLLKEFRHNYRSENVNTMLTAVNSISERSFRNESGESVWQVPIYSSSMNKLLKLYKE